MAVQSLTSANTGEGAPDHRDELWRLAAAQQLTGEVERLRAATERARAILAARESQGCTYVRIADVREALTLD